MSADDPTFIEIDLGAGAIPERLHAALTDLAQVLADEAPDVEGFGMQDFGAVKIGTGRAPVLTDGGRSPVTQTAESWSVCIGWDWTENTCTVKFT